MALDQSIVEGLRRVAAQTTRRRNVAIGTPTGPFVGPLRPKPKRISTLGGGSSMALRGPAPRLSKSSLGPPIAPIRTGVFAGKLTPEMFQAQFDRLERQRRDREILEEAARERDFEKQLFRERNRNINAVLRPIMERLLGDDAIDVTTDTTVMDSPEFSGLGALEESIRRTAERAQAEVGSRLAKRNLFRSGPSAAATALLQAETEGAVAELSFSDAARREESIRRRRSAREQALAQLAGQVATGAFL